MQLTDEQYAALVESLLYISIHAETCYRYPQDAALCCRHIGEEAKTALMGLGVEDVEEMRRIEIARWLKARA